MGAGAFNLLEELYLLTALAATYLADRFLRSTLD